MLKFQVSRWAGGTAAALLTAAAFAGGMHLRPPHVIGHDLVQTQASGRVSAESQTSRGLTFTGISDGTRVADSHGQNMTAHIAFSEDDSALTSPATTFQDVYSLLRRNYVEGVPDDAKMSHGAASAMLSSLQDTSTRFLEPEEFAEAKREQQGIYGGIGAVMDIRQSITPKTADDPTRDKDHPTNINYSLTVVTTLPASPAQIAGLKDGDIITDINGQWVATYDLVSAQAKELKAAQDKNDPVALNKLVQALQKKMDNALSLQQAQTKLRDPNAKALTLAVMRPGAPAPLTITVTPSANIKAAPITGKLLSDGTAYLKVSIINTSTGMDFTRTLASVTPQVKGLILDLRDTTGGTPEDASAIAARVSTATTIGLRLGKQLKPLPINITPARAITGPLIVLINGGTEGAAELLASALKANGAKLVGTRTFGEDKDVRTVALPDGSGFTMTVGRLLLASGAQYGGTGIVPDIPVTDTESPDSTLQRAVTEITGQVAHR